jgi:hypothetical protein
LLQSRGALFHARLLVDFEKATMTVYVDNMKMPWRGMIMSHMMADELDELHEMAARIGMKLEWFQGEGHSIPHYDVSEGKRQQAIRLGAVEEDMFSDAMGAFRREWRRRSRSSVRVWNCSKDKNIPLDAILVDRSTPFGNPFSHIPNAAARWTVASREEAVEAYRRWIFRKENLRLRMVMREILKGKDLVCHCAPQPCHWIVAEIANDVRFNDDDD